MQKKLQHSKALIKPLRQLKQESIHNIFASTSNNPEVFQPMEMHHFVGQAAWKNTVYGDILSKSRANRLARHLSQQEQVGANHQTLPFITDDRFGMSTNKSKNSKFCLDQLDEESRQGRTIQKFSETRNMWKRNEKVILQKVNKNKSLSFNAVKTLYLHPNPEKLTLINDNIPEYWKNSLRDNNKYLKKYLKGNPFKQQIAEEMLQTLAGRNKLEKSIPQMANCCEQMVLKGKNIKRKADKCKSDSAYLDETLKSDYSCRERWLNEISCTQTLTSKFNFQ